MNNERYEKMNKEVKGYFQSIIVGLTLLEELVLALKDISGHLQNIEEAMKSNNQE